MSIFFYQNDINNRRLPSILFFLEKLIIENYFFHMRDKLDAIERIHGLEIVPPKYILISDIASITGDI